MFATSLPPSPARSFAEVSARFALAGLLVAVAAAPAQALMIGQPQSVTELGMPLRMDIPVRLDEGESLPRDCIAVRAAAGEHGAGIGPLRIDTRPTRDGVMIEVQGARALVEPILDVRLQLGCQYQRTQAYTLLVDPPRPELPMTQGSVVAAAPVPAGRTRAAASAAAVKGPAPVASTTAVAAVTPAKGAIGGSGGRASAPRGAVKEPRNFATREPGRAPVRGQESPPLAQAHSVAPSHRVVLARPAAAPRLEMDWLAPDAVPAPHLQLATALPASAPAPSAARREQLLQLRQLLIDAAAAPGEPMPTLQQNDTLRSRNEAMTDQLAQATQQRDAAQAALQQQRASSYPAALVYALLAGLLALALLALWLWRRGAHPASHADVFGAALPAARHEPRPAPQPPVAAPARAAEAHGHTTVAASESLAPATVQPLISPFGLPVVGSGVPQPEVELPQHLAQRPAPAVSPDPADGIDWDSRFMQPLTQGELLQVDELMDAGHLAEYFIDMGDDQRAIALLEKSLDDSMADSFALPYLLLFDLYRKHGMAKEYRTLHTRFARRFNVRVPAWEESPDAHPRELPDYERAMALILRHWGEPHIVTVIERMLLDDPSQPRLGFDLPAYRDLLMLYAVARDLFPDHVVPPADVDPQTRWMADATPTRPMPEPQPAGLDLDFELPILDAPVDVPLTLAPEHDPAAPARARPAPAEATADAGSDVFQLAPRDSELPPR